MGAGPRYREVGGGPATGLANDFISFLQQGLQTGSFGGVTGMQRLSGSDPMGSTAGIAGVLNDLLAGGAGQLGGALNTLISRDIDRQAGALRARFGASGGTAFGTPAAFAESMLRAESAPRLASAVGGLQLQALGQLLPIFTNLSSRGIAQRQGYLQPPAWQTIAGLAAPIAGTVIGSMAGNPLAGASIGSSIGSSFTPQFSSPQFAPTPFDPGFRGSPFAFR